MGTSRGKGNNTEVAQRILDMEQPDAVQLRINRVEVPKESAELIPLAEEPALATVELSGTKQLIDTPTNPKQESLISSFTMYLWCGVLLFFAPVFVAMIARGIDGGGIELLQYGVAPALAFIPFQVATARGCEQRKVLWVNLLGGWTIVGWFYALRLALRSPISPAAIGWNLVIGERMAFFTAVVAMAGTGIRNDSFGTTLTVGTLYLQSALLAVHWAATSFAIHRFISLNDGKKSNIGKYEALFGSLLAPPPFGQGVSLATGALAIGHFFRYCKAHISDKLQLSFCAAGAGVFVWFVVAAYSLFSVRITYLLTRSIDEFGTGDRVPSAGFVLIRRLAPAAGFFAVNMYIPFAWGETTASDACCTFWIGMAFFAAYYFTRKLAQKRIPELFDKPQPALESTKPQTALEASSIKQTSRTDIRDPL